MKFEVQENYLTIYLPKDLDHHSAEEIKKRSGPVLLSGGHIRYVIFDLQERSSATVPESESLWKGIKKVCMLAEKLGGAIPANGSKRY